MGLSEQSAIALPAEIASVTKPGWNQAHCERGRSANETLALYDRRLLLHYYSTGHLWMD